MKRFIFLFLILLSFNLNAQENSTNTELPGVIDHIEISGLKRTKENYIQAVLKEFVGKPANEVKTDAVETQLQAQGVFSEIAVSILPLENNENSYLKVDVKEKITFIPMPFISYSSDGLMGGLMVMDMNAFGKKNMLVTGGIFSSSMQMGMMAFSKPSTDIRHPGFSSYLGFNHKDEKYESFDRETISEIDKISVSAQFTIHEKIVNGLQLSAGLKYAFHDVFDSDYGIINEWFGTAGISYSVNQWNGYYLNSSGCSFIAELGSSSDGDFLQSYKINGGFQFPFIIPRLRMGFKISGIWEDSKPIFDKSGKSSVGATIIGSRFKTDSMFCGSYHFEGAFLKIKMMTLSLYGTYEAIVAKDFDDSWQFSQGPGAGIKMYLSKIAFPACQIGTSYNIEQNRFNFVISLGVSF